MNLRLRCVLFFVLCTLFSCTESSPSLSSFYVCTVFDYGEPLSGARGEGVGDAVLGDGVVLGGEATGRVFGDGAETSGTETIHDATFDKDKSRNVPNKAQSSLTEAAARKPNMRLTLFVKPSSDLSRALTVSAEHVASGFEWIIGEPFFVTNKSGTWAGSPYLRPAYNETVPQGEYEITYTDAAMRKAALRAKVTYPNEWCALTFDSLLKNEAYASLTDSFTALYDEDGALIYFDATKSVGESDEAIVSKFPRAFTKRVFKTGKGITYGVFEPAERVAR